MDSRNGCALGAALVLLVAGWKLTSSSYRADVGTICEGESLAGLPARGDLGGVTERIRARLATPEGNNLLSRLRDLPIGERAERLRTEAQAVRLPRCPMVETYHQLAAEGEYRSDVQRLCSYVTFPGLRDLDDRLRIMTLAAWIEEAARTERLRELGTILRRAATTSEAVAALRDAAAEIDVFTCDTAKVLDTPLPVSCSAAAGGSRR